MSAGSPIQLVAFAGSNNGTQLLCLPVSCFHVKGNKLLATGCTLTDSGTGCTSPPLALPVP